MVDGMAKYYLQRLCFDGTNANMWVSRCDTTWTQGPLIWDLGSKA